MAAKEKFSVEAVETALRKSGGMFTGAAEILAKSKKTTCSRTTVANYVARHGHLRKVIAEIDESVKDEAETGLFAAIKQREPWAIRYFLNNRARDRGYGHAVRISGDAEAPIEHRHTVSLDDLGEFTLEQLAGLYAEAVLDPQRRATRH